MATAAYWVDALTKKRRGEQGETVKELFPNFASNTK